jgi:quercetin dioxygenase-like cupin family protein/DNA-binding transcriptional regulator YiaG
MPVARTEAGKAKQAGKARAATTGAASSVGRKIKAVRAEKGISLEQIANETGFTTAHLKEIEAGKATPSVGALLHIARALRIDSGSFLRERTPAHREQVKAYTQRTESYAYETLTPGAENKHLKAFHVTVEPGQEHTGVGYQHEGEEFEYVLRGTVEVVVGEHVNTLAAGESLHINSGIRHQLRNIGAETAELLVVIYSP